MNILIQAYGLGDCICCTPTLRKLSKAFNVKFNVYSRHPTTFENLPYINTSSDLTDVPQHIDYCFFQEHHMVQSCFYDLKQFVANEASFQLLDNELQLDYIPAEKSNNLYMYGLPKEYIVVHAPLHDNWPVKTWNVDKWQELCNNIELPIISIGKKEKIDSVNFNLHKLNNVIDLTNKLTLDQTWHLLDNAKYIITTDSAISHLSSTTITPCYLIAVGKHYKLHAYQNVVPIYSKNCKFCMSNIELIFGKKELDLRNCHVNGTNETCQPSVDQVLEVING